MIEDNFIRQRVAFLRDMKGVSAREMSLAMGQSEGYINKIETGAIQPSLKALDYICDYLNISLAQFFDTDSNIEPEKKLLINDIAKKLEQLNNPTLESLNKFVGDMLRN